MPSIGPLWLRHFSYIQLLYSRVCLLIDIADDYIRVKNIKHPNSVPERSALSLSKFDRYRERDDDEEDDDGDVKVDTNAMLNDFDFMEQDKTDGEIEHIKPMNSYIKLNFVFFFFSR